MTGINNIDYSTWTNTAAKELAQQADTNGIKGLQGKEIFAFARSAQASDIEQTEIFEILGLSIPAKSRAAAPKSAVRPSNPAFDKAVAYYNDKMNSYQRYSVTSKTYDVLTQRLYKMEKDIDQAFIDCQAYSDIVIVPRWHYRFYPRFDDRLINFDIDELRQVTSRDMASLQELKDKVQTIIEEANGETEHTEVQKTEYDVDALAQKHFGMSYEEFDAKYHNELEFCKTVTMADMASMTDTQRYVYSKAKAYATEMLNTTITEAHTVNWDAGERKTEETLKATGDMYAISEFEYDGITEQGLSDLQSGIMYKSFEEALISKHQEYDPTGIKDVKVKSGGNEPIKRVVHGEILIFHPNGSVFDSQGRKIK